MLSIIQSFLSIIIEKRTLVLFVLVVVEVLLLLVVGYYYSFALPPLGCGCGCTPAKSAKSIDRRQDTHSHARTIAGNKDEHSMSART